MPSAPVQGSAAGAVGAAAAVPTLTVTPSTDLVAGQQVTIAGTGFAAGQYLIAQCTAGGSDPNACDLNGVLVVTPDASGAFSQDAPLRRTLRLFDQRVDCASAPGTCEVVAIDFRTFEGAVARAPLSFDPSAPLPNPTIAVTPSTGLLTGQQVTVTGSGFVAGDTIVVSQCAADDPFCFAGFGSPVPVGADGHFTTTVAVHLRVNTAIGGLTNCLAVACVVQAGSFNDPDYLATAPLTFDPSQPLPPVPAITVTPNTALRHDQLVQVHGTGFDPQSGIEISECPPDTSGFCNDYLADVLADGNGAFDASVPVSRLVSSFDFEDEEQTVDCGPGGCSISASAYESDVSLSASAPIAFDASIPPPALPVVTVTPNSNLPFRTAVAVHGTGYAPGEQVYADYCLNSPSSGTCGFESGFGVADANGTIDLTLTVRRRVSFPGGGGDRTDRLPRPVDDVLRRRVRRARLRAGEGRGHLRPERAGPAGTDRVGNPRPRPRIPPDRRADRCELRPGSGRHRAVRDDHGPGVRIADPVRRLRADDRRRRRCHRRHGRGDPRHQEPVLDAGRLRHDAAAVLPADRQLRPRRIGDRAPRLRSELAAAAPAGPHDHAERAPVRRPARHRGRPAVPARYPRRDHRVQGRRHRDRRRL